MSRFAHEGIDEAMAWAQTKLTRDEFEHLSACIDGLPAADLERLRARMNAGGGTGGSGSKGMTRDDLRRGLARLESLSPAELERALPAMDEAERFGLLVVARSVVDDGFAIDPGWGTDADPLLRILLKLRRALVEERRAEQ
jgi:hypothetical protein